MFMLFIKVNFPQPQQLYFKSGLNLFSWKSLPQDGSEAHLRLSAQIYHSDKGDALR